MSMDVWVPSSHYFNRMSKMNDTKTSKFYLAQNKSSVD